MAEKKPWRWPLCFNPLLLCNLITSSRPGPWRQKSLLETSENDPIQRGDVVSDFTDFVGDFDGFKYGYRNLVIQKKINGLKFQEPI